jgi:hypothetical protein
MKGGIDLFSDSGTSFVSAGNSYSQNDPLKLAVIPSQSGGPKKVERENAESDEEQYCPEKHLKAVFRRGFDAILMDFGFSRNFPSEI